MSSVNYENQILDAIETMVDNAVSKAGYDRTIQGTIISLEDAETGKYKIKYQDSEIEAYSSNIDIKYPEGTLVYITIPNNDFSKTKTILDTVDKEAIERNIIKEEDEQYEIEVGNSISAIQEFELCSYKDNNKLYLYDVENNVNNINFDPIVFSESIAETRMILCGAKFKTDLPVEQQKSGNFGFGVTMEFTDNITGDVIQKDFVVDVNRMTGSPYDQKDYTKQYDIFEISNENFIQVKSIYIFEKGFPYIITNDNLLKNDIFIKDFELYGLRDLSNSNGYTLVLSKPGKGYFNEFSLPTDTVTIESVLRNDGKIVNNTEIQYYWFRENNEVKINDVNYINYAGEGWECINEYNIVDEQTKMWLTQNDKCVITRSFCNSSCTNIKCIVVKREEILAKDEICIYVYEGNTELSIISSLGTKFYFDNGRPTLTCYVDKEENLEDYTYSWSMVDVNGTVTELLETYDENIEYNEAIADRDLIQAKIATEEIMPAAVQADLDALQVIVDKYDNIQRVEKNKLIKIDMRQVTNYTTFKCLVKKQDLVVGTAAITLHNRLLTEGEYVLNIINGTQVFTYDDLGVSPVNSSLERPITIEPLTFTITDNLGYLLSDIVLEECDVQWEVPTENTLLVGESSNNLSLRYGIVDEYNINKTNNDIKLTVKYKNLTLEAKTNFIFVKQGEPGTNGSDIICKIVPNTNNSNFDDYPMVLNGIMNYGVATPKKWFRIQLWENGQKIFDGTDSSGSFTVEWKVLQNKYNTLNGTPDTVTKDSSSIIIEETNDHKYEFNWDKYQDDQPANIIQGIVTYQGISYYCTMPIITAETSSDYAVKLIKNTGFRYVCYSSDGRNPMYDNAEPFTLQVTKVINGFVEDISTVSNDYRVTYVWSTQGRVKNGTSWISDKHLIPKNNLMENSKIYFPKDDYNGECLTDAIEVKIKDKDDIQIAKIHIPVHFYLNRHGLAGIESWDGNSISIDNAAGRILTPQAGAGLKESDGTFTGVYMGAVRERGRTNSDVGLIGYHKGIRSLFLNSKNGSAIFGKGGNGGQIIVDPQTDKALLYSNNFWKSYHTDDENVGLPINYTENNENPAGMLIDLATPEIRFGSGKFKVDKNGELTAAGGGHIGGWTIGKDGSDDVLYNNQLFLNGTKGQVYTTKKSLDANSDGFYLGKEGIGLGKTTTYEGVNGESITKSIFQVDNSGNLYANNVILKGKITATSGYIGNGASGWTIKNTYIYNTKTGLADAKDGVYIGTNGIALGANSVFSVTNTGTLTAKSGTIANWKIETNKLWYGGSVDNPTLYLGTANLGANKTIAGHAAANWRFISGSNFGVDSSGNLYSSGATISGTINATAGTFGNGTNKITIGTNGTGNANSAIYYGKSNFNTNASGFYIGTNGIALGAVADGTSAFQVTTAGALTAKSATISGTLSAGAGSTIGPWTVTADAIYNGKSSLTANTEGVYIGKDGISLGTGSTFKVTKAGAITATSGEIAGWTLGANALYTASNALYLGNTGITATIGGTNRSNIVFKAGDNFGVTNTGTIYAKNAVLSDATVGGTITATAGTIGGCSIDSNGDLKISSGHITSVSANTISSGMLDVYNGTGFLRMGFASSGWTSHPYVSRLNVASATADPGSGSSGTSSISFRSASSRTGAGNQIGYVSFGSGGSGRVYANVNMNIDAGSAVGIKSGTYVNLNPDGELRINGTAGVSKDFWTGDYANIHFVIKKGIITTCTLTT